MGDERSSNRESGLLKKAAHTVGVIARSDLVFRVLLPLALLSLSVAMPVWAQEQGKAPAPLKQDESCLACHGQPGMTSGSGKTISIDPARHSASVHGILGCVDCHSTIKDYPHPAKEEKVLCATCHADEAGHVPGSVHGT